METLKNMDIEDLHEMEDTFEFYDDNKKERAKLAEQTKEEKTLTSARRVTFEDNDVDDRWNRFKI
jgi:hypothetical protein